MWGHPEPKLEKQIEKIIQILLKEPNKEHYFHKLFRLKRVKDLLSYSQ